MTPRRRSPVPPPPVDPGLPGLAALLDAEVACRYLAASDPSGPPITGVEPRQLEYLPGRRCIVEWNVVRDGGCTTAVAEITAAAGVPEVWWYPHDPSLPGLASGLEFASGAGAGPYAAGWENLAYRPGVRAVRRLGDTVVKWYATSEVLDRAITAARWAEQLADVRSASLVGVDRARRCAGFSFVDGRPVSRSDAATTAPRAGGVLRAIHAADVASLPGSVTTEAVLDHAWATAELLTTLRPDLALRIVRVVRRLERTRPAHQPGVASHGDFNVSQLLLDGGEIVVLDFDELCVASPAYDLAAYAANVAGGRAGDGERVASVLDAVCDGYGSRPADLEWYLGAALLGRTRSAFRLQKSKWPERLQAGLELVEQVVGG